MEIRYGCIYKCDDGLFRLIIGDVFKNGHDKLFVYSSLNRNEDKLFNVKSIGLEHPTEGWHFFREATVEEFRQALVNFKAIMSQQPRFEEYDYEESFGKTAPRM